MNLLMLLIFSIGVQSSQIILEDLEVNLDLEYLVIALLRDLTLYRDLKCVAIICDSVYLNVFVGEFFMRIVKTPSIMIVVGDQEDLLSPNFDTLQSIQQARRDGCGIYVILLANGYQTCRLLKFGDKYRILDTRAKYIMLHDFRMFENHMHYIWKRIVNVVFLRHHKKLSNSLKSQSWFDLSTVPFPTPIKSILVTKRLDTWKKGKFYNGRQLFQDKTSDLNGEVLNVVYLEHVPAVTSMSLSGNTSSIGGIEIEILKTLAKIMNFEPYLYEPMNARLHRWGQKQVNGSYSGLLGEMVNGKADVALGNLQYTPYHLELTDLSIPYISQCLTFLTPEALTDNSWKTLILPFKLSMWIAVIIMLLITGLIFYGLANYQLKLLEYHNSPKEPSRIDKLKMLKEQSAKIESKINPEQDEIKPVGIYLFSEIISSILYTYGMLLVVSLPKLPTGWSVRLLTGWYWLYCILLVVSYKASMTAILANPAPRVTIDTLTELVDSKITCGGWGTETKNFFQNSLDETTQIIGERFEITNDPDEAIRKIAKGIYAYYDNEYYLKYISVKRQNLVLNNRDIDDINSTNETDVKQEIGERNLHIMSDCVVNIPISIGLQKNSPLKPRADEYVQRIIEVGLVEKWLNDAMHQIRTVEIANENEVKALMNLKKLYGAYIALAIGYTLSFLCLMAELIQWHCVTKKDPAFDKYAMDLYYGKRKTQQFQ